MPRALTCDASLFAKLTVELFHSGRRTVSFRDWLQRLDREYDADFADRAVDQLLEVAKLLEERGYPCTPVNDFCVRLHAEEPITDVATARRCNVYNSGGKRPVGLRQAWPDDLVRSEVNGSGAHLGIGLLKHSVRENVNDVAQGITTPEIHERLRNRLREQLPTIPEIQPDEVQAPLPALTNAVDED